MVASILPLCVAIQSKHNEKYLTYVKEGKAHKHLRFSGQEIVTRSTKFAVEWSSKHKEMVHLRCCHNNKYLVKKSKVEQWIIAAADAPQEDDSIWSSTLFEPTIVENYDDHGQIVLRLKHAQSKLNVCLMINKGQREQQKEDDEEDALSNCLYLGSSLDDPNIIDDSIDVFKFIDWGTLVILPKRIALKSNTHGKYLVSSSSKQTQGEYPCIQSASDDKADASVHEVVTNPNGTIGIKACDADGLWTAHDDCEIDVEPLQTNEKKSLENMTIFQNFVPIKISSNAIAIRCSSLGKFCDINSDSQQLECKADSILQQAKFVVEEVIVSREVYNIKFHPEDARIYDKASLVLSSSTISNASENSMAITDKVFKVQDERSNKWSNGCSLSFGVKAKFSSEGVPFISGNGTVEIIGGQVGEEREWGELQTVAIEMHKDTKTQSTIRLVSTRGTCDVPFSYTVHEVYVDGTEQVYEADDGVYTATNSYEFRTGIENKPI